MTASVFQLWRCFGDMFSCAVYYCCEGITVLQFPLIKLESNFARTHAEVFGASRFSLLLL